MVSGVNNFSGAQTLRALNAFRADEKTVKEAKGQQNPEVQNLDNADNQKEIALRDEISHQRANEIKKYGEMFDIKISNSDINYALSYGRSVLVDYNA